MKDWPENNEPASFADMAETARRLLTFAYTLRRKNRGKSIPVTGLDAPGTTATPPGSVTLSAENLAYSLEEQGRDALDEIIGVILHIGMEQGRRAALRDETAHLRAAFADESYQMMKRLFPGA